MPQNEHTRHQGCLNTVALVMASISVSLGLWACIGVATGILPPYQPEETCQYEPYTDSWIELCQGGEVDLQPIEDELQTPKGSRE